MGNFPQHFPQEFPTRFPARFSHQDFLQDFPARFSSKIFPQEFPARISRNDFPQRFPTRFSHNIFPQDFPARFSHNNFPQDFPATISHNNFLQQFPTTISCKIFPSFILIGWLPMTLFQMLNFHQSLPFFNWLFPLLLFPQDFPARISHKIFPQDFPELDPDWLAPHDPIPNAKFPPITALLNRPTYHKRSKVSPPPFPQILWEPQINE